MTSLPSQSWQCSRFYFVFIFFPRKTIEKRGIDSACVGSERNPIISQTDPISFSFLRCTQWHLVDTFRSVGRRRRNKKWQGHCLLINYRSRKTKSKGQKVNDGPVTRPDCSPAGNPQFSLVYFCFFLLIYSLFFLFRWIRSKEGKNHDSSDRHLDNSDGGGGGVLVPWSCVVWSGSEHPSWRNQGYGSLFRCRNTDSESFRKRFFSAIFFPVAVGGG